MHLAGVTLQTLRGSAAPIWLWLAIQLLTACGCRYDGTSMQMNSDSGAPFFGLQLSVRADHESREPEHARTPAGRHGNLPRVIGTGRTLVRRSLGKGIAAAGTGDILQAAGSGSSAKSASTGVTGRIVTGSPAAHLASGAGQLVLTSAASEQRSPVRYSIAVSGHEKNTRTEEISTRLNGF